MVAPWGHGSRCLLKGTLVTTPNGPVAVEKLCVGDLVTTVSGECLPIKWIGWQNYRAGEADWNESVMPIRVRRHALDGRTPHRDLYLSPNHALFIDGVLIRVKDLVNGRSIMRIPVERTLDYYNIVLDRHAVVLAEGAAVETFLMRGDGYRGFTNFSEYERLYPDEAEIVMQPCAPAMGYEGARQHMRALLGLSGIVPVRDVVEETYRRARCKSGIICGLNHSETGVAARRGAPATTNSCHFHYRTYQFSVGMSDGWYRCIAI